MAFGEVLKRIRTKAKISQYGLATDAQVDPAYVWRLEKGERSNPRRDTILRLGSALMNSSGKITLKDVDRLMKAAGYGPVPRKSVTFRKFWK